MSPISLRRTQGVRVTTLDPKDASRRLQPSSSRGQERLPKESHVLSLEENHVGSLPRVPLLLPHLVEEQGANRGGTLLREEGLRARVLVKVVHAVDRPRDQDLGAEERGPVALDQAGRTGQADTGLNPSPGPDRAPILRGVDRDHHRDLQKATFLTKKL